jgi:hypothetical protein
MPSGTLPMVERSKEPEGWSALARATRWLGLAVLPLSLACRSVLLPPAVGSSRAAAPPERFDRQTIFSYMDGAAEVYLMHGFRGLWVRRYATPGGPQVLVEVFDMGSPEGAYGAFSHSGDMEGEEVAVGQGGHYLSGLLSFWKGRYLVSLSAPDGPPTARQVLEPIALAVAAALRAEGRPPDLVRRLPGRGLRPGTVRYFRSPAALGHYCDPLARLPEFDGSGEGVLGHYRRKSGTALLLLLRLSDAARAARAREVVLQRLVGGAGALFSSASGQRPDGKWTAARAAGRMLAVVVEARTDADARDLLAEAFSSGKGEER